ncbi:MAG: hypothetical protein U0R52_06175 [Solirubrobacterales bacterium]
MPRFLKRHEWLWPVLFVACTFGGALIAGDTPPGQSGTWWLGAAIVGLPWAMVGLENAGYHREFQAWIRARRRRRRWKRRPVGWLRDELHGVSVVTARARAARDTLARLEEDLSEAARMVAEPVVSDRLRRAAREAGWLREDADEISEELRVVDRQLWQYQTDAGCGIERVGYFADDLPEDIPRFTAPGEDG